MDNNQRQTSNGAEIIPTVVPKTFDDVVAAKDRYSDFSLRLHIDATDGQFAPNKTWLPFSGEKLPDAESFEYEAHLMVEGPLSLGLNFARAGARRLIAHIETFNTAENARETFSMWRKAGVSDIVVAILLDTPLSEFAPYITLCDGVHLMTIAQIGKQGIKFDERGIARVRDVHTRYPSLVISTDGGETRNTIDDLARAGASRFCVGSALMRAKDPRKEYARLVAAATV